MKLSPLTCLGTLLVAALQGCATTTFDPSPVFGAGEPTTRSVGEDGNDEPALVARQETSSRRGPEAGDLEVTVSASGGNDEDFEVGVGGLNAGVNFFLSEQWALVVRQTETFSDFGPGTDSWNASTRLGIDYNFPTSTLIPYAGVLFGWVYGNTIQETFVAGPEAGLKWYIKDEAFLQLGAEYQFFIDENDEFATQFTEEGQFIYGIGFGLKF